MKALVQEFWQEEDGLQTIEIVLILVVTIGLVTMLRSQAMTWLEKITGVIDGWVNSNTAITP